ncbi:MAG: hypothetical protein HZA17_11075 [Nitrospirae bacterium]|nr:hypothetical protein [Nitrospirota bacterium]
MKGRNYSAIMPGSVQRLLIVVAAYAMMAAGCATSMKVGIESPIIPMDNNGEEKARITGTLTQIETRNRTIEDSADWIRESYNGFMIKNLAEMDERDFSRYGRYLDNGSVYVVVHPAYYTFFQDSDIIPDNSNGNILSQNAVERFLSDGAFSAKTKLIKAQEKMLRDFLEYMSAEKKLVILIMPKGYNSYAGYKYRNGMDEYMRFINEVTNESDSVLYLYSKKPNRGTLGERDRKKLLKFLYSVRANSILLGGGYIGRCLEDFYKDIEQFYGEDKIYVVPEITAISPSDMTSNLASDILQSDGTVNVGKLSFSIKNNSLGNQEITPLIRNLSAVEHTP